MRRTPIINHCDPTLDPPFKWDTRQEGANNQLIIKMKKKCKIVMLSTNITSNTEVLHIESGGRMIRFNSYHLYIISDDEIKEGDWCVTNLNKMEKFNSPWKGEIEISYKQETRKIIASTDSSLNLPNISEEFIKLYIEKYNSGNPIDEIEVEYEEFVIENGNSKPFKITKYFINKCQMTGIKRNAVEYFIDGGLIVRSSLLRDVAIISILKLDSNNCISIQNIKDSYTKEKVANKIREFRNALLIEVQKGIVSDFTEKWIEKNL